MLDASELWIWTDVDGIMTADPRLVPDAAVLDEVTYNEAAELAYNGAKVLHPRTLAPLVEKQIPVWSKNSFAPEQAGHEDRSEDRRAWGPRAVTSMANVALISIEPASPELNVTQLIARALDALGRANAEVLVLSSSSYRQSFCFLVRKEELATALAALEAGLALELAHGYLQPIEVDDSVGLLAVVGEGMRGTPGLAGRIFTAISRESDQHHRHRPGIERADHRDRGAAGWPGEGGAGGSRRVPHGRIGARDGRGGRRNRLSSWRLSYTGSFPFPGDSAACLIFSAAAPRPCAI